MTSHLTLVTHAPSAMPWEKRRFSPSHYTLYILPFGLTFFFLSNNKSCFDWMIQLFDSLTLIDTFIIDFFLLKLASFFAVRLATYFVNTTFPGHSPCNPPTQLKCAEPAGINEMKSAQRSADTCEWNRRMRFVDMIDDGLLEMTRTLVHAYIHSLQFLPILFRNSCSSYAEAPILSGRCSPILSIYSLIVYIRPT